MSKGSNGEVVPPLHHKHPNLYKLLLLLCKLLLLLHKLLLLLHKLLLPLCLFLYKSLLFRCIPLFHK
jgi:hypothetical protein